MSSTGSLIFQRVPKIHQLLTVGFLRCHMMRSTGFQCGGSPNWTILYIISSVFESCAILFNTLEILKCRGYSFSGAVSRGFSCAIQGEHGLHLSVWQIATWRHTDWDDFIGWNRCPWFMPWTHKVGLWLGWKSRSIDPKGRLVHLTAGVSERIGGPVKVKILHRHGSMSDPKLVSFLPLQHRTSPSGHRIFMHLPYRRWFGNAFSRDSQLALSFSTSPRLRQQGK